MAACLLALVDDGDNVDRQVGALMVAELMTMIRNALTTRHKRGRRG